MPSQEDYLDQLLKGISEEPQMEVPSVDVPEFDMSLLEMSEEELAGLEVAELEQPEEETDLPEMIEIDAEEDILKKMVRENATIEDVLNDADESETVDELMSDDIMTVDEIEQILAENNSDASTADYGMDALNDDADLLTLLEAASEAGGDLQDIHDMLQKEKLICLCGCKNILPEMGNEGITLRCNDCGAAYEIIASEETLKILQNEKNNIVLGKNI